ncbi:hypothetical protein [Herpetosiphon geysericola]|uniref:Uncharacterized protein n=1 Tax=Herpetosiphon geysericola TaxID=70996 RepID=A0A0P6YK19_9CHLR|nr:hypothetical protein [Herpetosiphon geysericola]KPL90091.1 hypothetical protein SE18_07685 [Herpetosiphon geysericola]
MTILGFGDEAIAAFIVFFLGIIVTLFFQRYSEKNPKLVYRIKADKISLDADDLIKDRISVFFDNKNVEKIYIFNITIENIGNVNINNQEILFSFDHKTRILIDTIIDLQPLVGPVHFIPTKAPLNLTTEMPYQEKYMIELLSKGQKVGFKFLTRDNLSQKVSIYSRNKENYVDVIEQSQQKSQHIVNKINRLIIGIFVFFIVQIGIDILFLFIEQEINYARTLLGNTAKIIGLLLLCFMSINIVNQIWDLIKKISFNKKIIDIIGSTFYGSNISMFNTIGADMSQTSSYYDPSKKSSDDVYGLPPEDQEK